MTVARRYDENHRMRNSLIRDFADGVIAQYRQKYPNEKWGYPVPVEAISDCLWDFAIDFDDLHGKYGPDTDGALFFFHKRLIVADNSLNPEVFPNKIGRYVFTVAHEIGHWVLHAPDMLANAEAPVLFGEQTQPDILCRSSKRDEKERQADRFAGYLLMPRDLILQVWNARHGENSPPLDVHKELEEQRERFHLAPDDRKVFCEEAKTMAALFSVSAQAMQIQLSEMGLIKLEEDFQGYLL